MDVNVSAFQEQQTFFADRPKSEWPTVIIQVFAPSCAIVAADEAMKSQSGTSANYFAMF